MLSVHLARWVFIFFITTVATTASYAQLRCQSLFQSHPTTEAPPKRNKGQLISELKKHVSLEVSEMVADVHRQLKNPQQASETFGKNLNLLESMLNHEIASHPIKSRFPFSQISKLKFKLIGAVKEKIDALRKSDQFRFQDQILLSAMVLDLISSEWNFSISYRPIEKATLDKLSQTQNSDQLIDLYVTHHLHASMRMAGSFGLQLLKSVLSIRDGWTIVPTGASLTIADMLYLNLNGIAPLWISTVPRAIDGILLNPLSIFLHDLTHYREQGIWQEIKSLSLSRLNYVQDLIHLSLSDNQSSVAISVAFITAHEIIEPHRLLSKNTIKELKYRFMKPDDLGILYQAYKQETGRSLDEFIDELTQHVDRHLLPYLRSLVK